MILETENLIIEPLSNKHVTQQYVGWLNDPFVGLFMETRHTNHTLDNIKEYIALEKMKGSYMFAIVHKEKNKHIGNIKIGSFDIYNKSADISYFIGDKNFWGQGLATEAVREMCFFAFSNLEIVHLSAGYYSSNKASEKVLLKCGFKVCGIFHDKLLTSNGVRDNHVYCELLKTWFVK